MILAIAASILAVSACGNNKKANEETECTECCGNCEGECTKADGEECCGKCADSTACAAADSTAVVAE